MKFRWYHGTLVAVAIPVAAIATYIGFVDWDIHRVKVICEAIRPGSSMDSARSIIRAHGLGNYIPDSNGNYPNGVVDKKTGKWFFAVAAGSTLGDWTCGIRHDGRKVLSTTMLGPDDY